MLWVPPVTKWMLLAGVASGVLYVVLYLAQRAVDGGAGAVGVGLVLYAATMAALFAVYLWMLTQCRRPLPVRLRILAFGWPCVIAVVWLLATPLFSIDVFSYVAHGYVQVRLSENPYVVPSRAVTGTDIGEQLASYGWRPVPTTPYGPVSRT